MTNQRTINGCYCGFCASLHGVRTVDSPADAAAERLLRGPRETYRDWLNQASKVHRAYLSRRFGESFA
jgi:hypothetical protein